MPVTQLLSALSGYPNGTQFAVWLYAPPPDRMQHYVYAEKYMGHVVVEDYQVNKADRNTADRPPPAAHTYLDRIPNKSLGSFAPNYFTHGCFWALKPRFVAKERAAEAELEREQRRPRVGGRSCLAACARRRRNRPQQSAATMPQIEH